MDSTLGKTQRSIANEAAPATPSSTVDHPSSSDPIRRYVLEMRSRLAPGLAPPFLIDGTVVYVTDDGGGVAQRLVERLTEAGAQAIVAGYVPADARSIICLAGLRAVSDVDAAIVANAEAFQIATTAAASFEAKGGLFVTVQATGGDFGLQSINGERAWLGGLSGLAKTAAQEWPQAVVRAIDIAVVGKSPDAIAERLSSELLSGGSDREIGLAADGGRYTFVSTERWAEGGAPSVALDSVIVVTGGGRGVTAAATIELARQAQPRIALLGRSVLDEEPADVRTIVDDASLKKALLAAAQARGERLTPRELGAAADRILAGREIRATLQALHAAGSQAVYLSCDITDPVATAAALDQVRAQWGPITGIVHGAGVLADKRLAEKNGDDFQRVFGTKIGGLRGLLAATAGDPLNVICLFSSVAARTGNAGQSDYAMANEVMNRVANELAKRHPGCVVKSIGWGPWEGGMVTPVLKAKFDEMGVPLIPLHSGARHFVAELQQADPAEVEVVIGGMPHDAPLLDPRAAGTLRSVTYDVIVSASTDPYLFSHQISGVVVVPLVMVQEWFLGAANASGGGVTYNALRKLRVLKGIPLPAFAEQPERLRIRLEPDSTHDAALSATLYDASGVARFAAQVVNLPATGGDAGQNRLADASRVWPGVTIDGADLYGVQLFHGPAFATIGCVDRLGEQGASASLIGSRSAGWEDSRLLRCANVWQTDPALMDGGLQLARVWGYDRLRQLTLPTAVDTVVVYEPGMLEAGREVRCLVEGRLIGQAGTRTNLWFVDARSGMSIAEIRGLEMYVSSEMSSAGDAR